MNSTTGDHNVALGSNALYANTTADYNVAIGSNALSANTTGSRNVVSGHDAGDLITTGSNNVILGNSADPSANNATNQIVIGYNATGNGDNEITLGNSSITTLRAQVTSITSLSDKRDKTEIVSLTEGLDFIKQLKPVSFTWDTRDKAKVGIKSAGFIAQDLLALQLASLIGENLDLVSEVNPEKLEARYANLLPVIVKAIQEESAMKDKEIADLKESVRLLQEQMKKLINQNKE
ncbi:tail fiber domain-containing protein [Cyclobacteriaceae bacterium]|nr:tail fiber domain-containing protein [Cyclobacteriaceae bacterium]